MHGEVRGAVAWRCHGTCTGTRLPEVLQVDGQHGLLIVALAPFNVEAVTVHEAQRLRVGQLLAERPHKRLELLPHGVLVGRGAALVAILRVRQRRLVGEEHPPRCAGPEGRPSTAAGQHGVHSAMHAAVPSAGERSHVRRSASTLRRDAMRTQGRAGESSSSGRGGPTRCAFEEVTHPPGSSAMVSPPPSRAVRKDNAPPAGQASKFLNYSHTTTLKKRNEFIFLRETVEQRKARSPTHM